MNMNSTFHGVNKRPLRDARDVFNVGEELYATEVKKQYHHDVSDNFIPIYDFYDVLFDMFNNLNHLNTDDKSLNKITLLEEYPDEEYTDGSIVVVYRVGEKKYFTHKSEGGQRDYTQVKPFDMKSEYDLITNNKITKMTNKFVTTISFDVVASSNRDLMRTVQYLESVFFKHKGHLKCYVSDFIYVGQTATEFNQSYQTKRLYMRSLVYQVVTYESYHLAFEEIKYIQ